MQGIKSFQSWTTISTQQLFMLFTATQLIKE
jgi:hypothetical protein